MTSTPYWNTSPSKQHDGSRMPSAPSRHVVLAALHVASLLDNRGSTVESARESYWRRATGGIFPPADLQRGELLLLEAGLAVITDGVLVRTPRLTELLDGCEEDATASVIEAVLLHGAPLRDVSDLDEATNAATAIVDDPSRREQLLIALRRRWDEMVRREVGQLGEELVVRAARSELTEMGHDRLARQVRRVSEASDQLGYDVVAPRIGGPNRLLEVKATAAPESDQLHIYLTRNEASVGARFNDWALVVCAVEDITTRRGSILGWWPWSSLAPHMPIDTDTAQWETAKVLIQREQLNPNLPRAIG